MKYFKNGIAMLLPLALVFFVFNWIYILSRSIVELILPESEWWYAIVGFLGAVGAVFLIGLIFSYIAPIKWAYKKIEKWFIQKTPVVKQIYNFGLEISDSFLSDIKEDGDLTVVAVKDQFGGEAIGVITDKQNNIIFIPTAPNPTNGFLTVNPSDVRIVHTMGYADAIKLVTSIGKINGGKVK